MSWSACSTAESVSSGSNERFSGLFSIRNGQTDQCLSAGMDIRFGQTLSVRKCQNIVDQIWRIRPDINDAKVLELAAVFSPHGCVHARGSDLGLYPVFDRCLEESSPGRTLWRVSGNSQIVTGDPSNCLQIETGTVVLRECDHSNTRAVWLLDSVNPTQINGSTRMLVSRIDDRCVDDSSSDGHLSLANCNPGNRGQFWTFIPGRNGHFAVVNQRHNACLLASLNQASIQYGRCRDQDPFQEFHAITFDYPHHDLFAIQSPATGRCMEAIASSSSQAVSFEQRACEITKVGQQFMLR